MTSIIVDVFGIVIFIGGFGIVNAVAIVLYSDYSCTDNCPDTSLKPLNMVMAALAVPGAILSVSYIALAGITMNCGNSKRVNNTQSPS
jgi:hypothetical protein